MTVAQWEMLGTWGRGRLLTHCDIDLERVGNTVTCPCRVTQDLQDRRAKQEKREDLGCLGGLARVAPWDLLDYRVLQEREATLGPQGLRGTQDCLVCRALW